MQHLKRHRIPLLLALLKFVTPFLLQDPVYQLHRDEYLYLAEGRHLEWGFLEVPPLLSLFSALTDLLGNGFFWVKCWPSLFGAFTVLVICEIVYEFGGRGFAQLTASLGLLTGVYMRTSFLFQPTFLEIFWWTLIALVIVKYINRNNPDYLYLLGPLMGLAFLSKYSVLFLAAGIFVALLLTPYRRVFLKKQLYIAVIIAALMALPNLVWQYNHAWPVLTHMKELRDTQLQFVSPIDFLKDQLLMHLPTVYLWLGGLAWLLISRNGRRYRLIGLIYVSIVVLFIITSGKNYYTLGAYPMLFAAGGVWLEQLTETSLRWMRYGAVAVTMVVAIYFIPLALPIWPPVPLAAYYEKHRYAEKGLLKWEDLENHPLQQDFADMTGWKEMADKVSRTYASLPAAAQKRTMIHCRNYGEAGGIAYYGKGLPQVNTDNASFLLWMPDRYDVDNILLVTGEIPRGDDSVFQQFARVRVIDSVADPLSREFGTKIMLFEQGNAALNGYIERSVAREKARFRR